MRQLNVKAYNFKADDTGTFEAYVAVFGNVDSYNERIEFGAFKNSIATRSPKIVWSHDFTRPIGKTLSIAEVPAGDASLPDELKEWGALRVKGALALKTRDGLDAYEHLQFGSIDEFSIGYEVKQSTPDTDGVTKLTELALYEYSPVLVGANPLTSLVNVKSLNMEQQVQMMDSLFANILSHADSHADMRGKAGRTVSGATHKLLGDVADSFERGAKTLKQFLKAHDPNAKDDTAARFLMLKQQLQKTRTN